VSVRTVDAAPASSPHAAPGRRSVTVRPGPVRMRPAVWWMHPAWTGLLAGLPCLAVTWLTPDSRFRLWWQTPKYFDATYGEISLLLLGAFALGAVLPSLARRSTTPAAGPHLTVTAAQGRILLRAGQVSLALTLTGYAVWATMALSRGYGGAQFHQTLGLEQGTLLSSRYQYFSTLPGITTLTQLGPLALVCLLVDRRTNHRPHTLALSVLAVLTLGRAFIDAERLALLEMVIPAIVVAAALRSPHAGKPGRTWFWAMLPLIAPMALAVVFGIFEYTRSWNDFYAQHSGTGFVEFALLRLAGYYATASNNAVILLNHLAPSIPVPFFTVEFVWTFPLFGSLFDVNHLLGQDAMAWSTIFKAYGNAEMINDGGLLLAIADYGLVGALIFCGALGLVLGTCYRSMRSGDIYGLVPYAVLYVGLLDLERIFYWGLGRTFPIIVGAIVTSALLYRARHA
jgi:hypothetical protein